jgi:hypothetical protein
MKHVDYLYFNIYSYCYRLSQYRQNFNARIQAMYLFSLGSGGWLLFLQALFLHLKHSRFSSRGESAIFAGAIFMLTGVLSNYIFIVKERDLDIFGKYEELSCKNPRRKIHLIISLGILLLPYLALLCFAIFFPRHAG